MPSVPMPLSLYKRVHKDLGKSFASGSEIGSAFASFSRQDLRCLIFDARTTAKSTCMWVIDFALRPYSVVSPSNLRKRSSNTRAFSVQAFKWIFMPRLSRRLLLNINFSLFFSPIDEHVRLPAVEECCIIDSSDDPNFAPACKK